MPPSEANAHGGAPGLCQLLIKAADEPNASQQRLPSLLAAVLAEAPEVFLLVISSFETVETTNSRLGTIPVATIGGMNLYRLGARGGWATETLQIEAEELALFACDALRVQEYIARVDAQATKWWRLGASTLRGELTMVPSIVDPVVFYARSHHSLEILGTRSAVKHAADMAWQLL